MANVDRVNELFDRFQKDLIASIQIISSSLDTADVVDENGNIVARETLFKRLNDAVTNFKNDLDVDDFKTAASDISLFLLYQQASELPTVFPTPNDFNGWSAAKPDALAEGNNLYLAFGLGTTIAGATTFSNFVAFEGGGGSLSPEQEKAIADNTAAIQANKEEIQKLKDNAPSAGGGLTNAERAELTAATQKTSDITATEADVWTTQTGTAGLALKTNEITSSNVNSLSYGAQVLNGGAYYVAIRIPIATPEIPSEKLRGRLLDADGGPLYDFRHWELIRTTTAFRYYRHGQGGGGTIETIPQGALATFKDKEVQILLASFTTTSNSNLGERPLAEVRAEIEQAGSSGSTSSGLSGNDRLKLDLQELVTKYEEIRTSGFLIYDDNTLVPIPNNASVPLVLGTRKAKQIIVKSAEDNQGGVAIHYSPGGGSAEVKLGIESANGFEAVGGRPIDGISYTTFNYDFSNLIALGHPINLFHRNNLGSELRARHDIDFILSLLGDGQIAKIIDRLNHINDNLPGNLSEFAQYLEIGHNADTKYLLSELARTLEVEFNTDELGKFVYNYNSSDTPALIAEPKIMQIIGFPRAETAETNINDRQLIVEVDSNRDVYVRQQRVSEGQTERVPLTTSFPVNSDNSYDINLFTEQKQPIDEGFSFSGVPAAGTSVTITFQAISNGNISGGVIAFSIPIPASGDGAVQISEIHFPTDNPLGPLGGLTDADSRYRIEVQYLASTGKIVVKLSKINVEVESFVYGVRVAGFYNQLNVGATTRIARVLIGSSLSGNPEFAVRVGESGNVIMAGNRFSVDTGLTPAAYFGSGILVGAGTRITGLKLANGTFPNPEQLQTIYANNAARFYGLIDIDNHEDRIIDFTGATLSVAPHLEVVPYYLASATTPTDKPEASGGTISSVPTIIDIITNNLFEIDFATNTITNTGNNFPPPNLPSGWRGITSYADRPIKFLSGRADGVDGVYIFEDGVRSTAIFLGLAFPQAIAENANFIFVGFGGGNVRTIRVYNSNDYSSIRSIDTINSNLRGFTIIGDNLFATTPTSLIRWNITADGNLTNETNITGSATLSFRGYMLFDPDDNSLVIGIANTYRKVTNYLGATATFGAEQTFTNAPSSFNPQGGTNIERAIPAGFKSNGYTTAVPAVPSGSSLYLSLGLKTRGTEAQYSQFSAPIALGGGSGGGISNSISPITATQTGGIVVGNVLRFTGVSGSITLLDGFSGIAIRFSRDVDGISGSTATNRTDGEFYYLDEGNKTLFFQSGADTLIITVAGKLVNIRRGAGSLQWEVTRLLR